MLLYVLSLLHGLGRLTAEPRFWLFLIIPGTIYVIDKITTLRTRYMQLDILETKLLPSDVLKIKFYRPPNMKVHLLSHAILCIIIILMLTYLGAVWPMDSPVLH